MNRHRDIKSGFTLVEVLVVMVVVGILAAVALPKLREAVYQAETAKIGSDVRTVEMGIRTYMEDQGALPAGGKWGVPPPALASYLPDGFSFTYKTLSYRIVTQAKQGRIRLEIRYPNRDPIGTALQRLRGDEVTWTKTKTTFWFER